MEKTSERLPAGQPFFPAVNMFTIAICDDIPQHSQQLKALLLTQTEYKVEVTSFQTPAELLAIVRAGQTFDIFFLDIELGSESGISLAAELGSLAPRAQIIFVTANLINAVDVGEATHIYFLLKPVDHVRLIKALNRAAGMLYANMDRRLIIPVRGCEDAILSSGSILYCERSKRTTTIVLHNETCYTAANLDALEQQLPQHLFARPHNSFLVNLAHVTKLERCAVHMDNGEILSVSNQRRAAFRDAFSAYAAAITE